MSRINSNVASLTAQRHLIVSQRALSLSLERLSSGLRINRGADDPAGLIVSERLRAEIAAVDQAIDNSARAINVIATTEGALNEVAALLSDIQALVIEAANSGAFSDDEIAANQLQMDDAIDSITRIANTTNFAGRKLLNGGLDYITSGITRTALADVNVLGAKFGSRTSVPVEVKVTTSAQQGQLTFAMTGVLATAATVDIAGPDGIITLTFPASATSNDIVTAINAQTDSTGITASTTGASSNVVFNTIEYGSRAFLSITGLTSDADFPVTRRDGSTVNRTTGRDAVATINGVSTTADGLTLTIQQPDLKVPVILSEPFGASAIGTSHFEIIAGAPLFHLTPPDPPTPPRNIGVSSIQANKLGNAIVGFLSELKSGQRFSLRNEKFLQAQKVINEVITEVSVLRGRLGAFERNSLRPNISQLQITSENLKSAQAVIRDTDFAKETSELTRAQILVQAGTSILAIANAQSQNVLSLLGG